MKRGIKVIDSEDIRQDMEVRKLMGQNVSYRQAHCDAWRAWNGRAKNRQQAHGDSAEGVTWESQIIDRRYDRRAEQMEVRDAVATLPLKVREKAERWLAGELDRSTGLFHLPYQLRDKFSLLFGVE
jgi:alkanesulfonate monooxygenase SsuD/methylene tetrahydromethanopterin reductase-like flavin-dependent oxidoreductase (luciferase family)